MDLNFVFLLRADMIAGGEVDPNGEMVQGLFSKFLELCPGKNPADGLQLQVLKSKFFGPSDTLCIYEHFGIEAFL